MGNLETLKWNHNQGCQYKRSTFILHLPLYIMLKQMMIASSLSLFLLLFIVHWAICVMNGNPHSKDFFLWTIAYWLSIALGFPWPAQHLPFGSSLTHTILHVKQICHCYTNTEDMRFLGRFFCMRDLSCYIVALHCSQKQMSLNWMQANFTKTTPW